MAAAGPGTIGRNTIRVLASQVSGNAGYFASVLVLARAFNPTDRGTFAFITSAALVTSQIANIGVSDATSVLGARSVKLRPTLLANITLMALGGSAAAALGIAAILELVPGLRPSGVGIVELAIFVLGATGAASGAAGYAFLQGSGRFRPYSRVQASVPWLYAAALVVTQLSVGLTIVRAIVIWTAVEGLCGALLLTAAAAETGWTRPDLGVLRDSIRFGMRAWVGSLSHLFNARTDQIIIAIISTEAILGIYAVAVNASEILYYLPSSAAAALLPAVAGGDASGRVDRTLRVYRAVLLLTVLAALVAAALGPLMLPLVFGHAYEGAVGPFLILVPSGVGFATMSVFSRATLGSLAPGRSSLGPIAALISQTALDLILIPSAGASGAAIAATSALFIGGAVAVSLYRAKFPFAWRLLLPHPRDLGMISRLVRRILRPPRVAPS